MSTGPEIEREAERLRAMAYRDGDPARNLSIEDFEEIAAETLRLKAEVADQARLAAYKDETATTFMNQVKKLQAELEEAQEKLRLQNKVAKTVWTTHEKQFAEQQAELEQARAACANRSSVLIQLANAARNLLRFSKHNDFPESPFSKGAHELTNLLDLLESALIVYDKWDGPGQPLLTELTQLREEKERCRITIHAAPSESLESAIRRKLSELEVANTDLEQVRLSLKDEPPGTESLRGQDKERREG